jgi:hypothetical protein
MDEQTAAGRREAMTAGVREALLRDGKMELGQLVTEFGTEVSARRGFTVQPTSGVSAIVTFQGTPPESRPIRDFLASYARTLTNAGFWAEPNFTAGYVVVEVRGR